MCGICGIVDFRPGAVVERETILAMCALLAHRGPNHEGVRIHDGAGLGHRRLTLTDLVTGQQPLSNEDGTVWVVFNGEIYNYKEQRVRLEALGHRFSTQSDTEVIAHLYEEHGAAFTAELEGNWAIGLWDETRRRLILTRDRLGKKPLVWMLKDSVVRFASEAKAILADPSVSRELDQHGLLDVIWFGNVVEDRTMFRDLRMLLPATTLVFEDGRLVSEEAYWDCNDVPVFEGEFEDAIASFSEVFSDVTRQRLMGDVPYGLLLSGGIDSALIASFIADHEPDLKTFTIATGDSDDETEAAGLVARHVGTTHTVIPLSDADPLAIAAQVPWMVDQPFWNDAAIANHLVARSVADEITAAITGDGGDHAFSGTLRQLGDSLAGSVPRPLAAVGAAAADLGHSVTRSRKARRLSKGFHAARIPERRRWLSMREYDLPIRHRDLLETALWRTNGSHPEAEALARYDRCTSPDHLNRLLYAETRWDLPPNDLLKVDRTFMYASIAGRSPFLDRRVVEFAGGIPVKWKRDGRTLKVLLREVARRRLPAEVVDLPKTGLAVPLRDWLRGPIGDKVAGLLSSESFAGRGVYDPQGAKTALERHRSGRGDYGYALWTMAMTEIFFRSYVDTFARPDERVWE